MSELKRRIKKYNKQFDEKLKFKDCLYPMNNGKAVIDRRYRKNLPAFLKVVEKYGPKEAHSIMLNAQSIKEIEKYAK